MLRTLFFFLSSLREFLLCLSAADLAISAGLVTSDFIDDLRTFQFTLRFQATLNVCAKNDCRLLERRNVVGDEKFGKTEHELPVCAATIRALAV